MFLEGTWHLTSLSVQYFAPLILAAAYDPFAVRAEGQRAGVPLAGRYVLAALRVPNFDGRVAAVYDPSAVRHEGHIVAAYNLSAVRAKGHLPNPGGVPV